MNTQMPITVHACTAQGVRKEIPASTLEELSTLDLDQVIDLHMHKLMHIYVFKFPDETHLHKLHRISQILQCPTICIGPGTCPKTNRSCALKI